jgi:GR25 family glycosyltransferase involved in LPS biosynthesis
MDILVINLKIAAQRRDNVRESFANARFPAHWALRVMPAVTAEEVTQNQVATSLTPAETGCFLSHLQCLQIASAHQDHVVIAEDDVIFCPQTASAVDAAISRLAPDAWDVLFTDLAVPRAEDMLQLFRLRRQLMQNGGFELLDLKAAIFCGATAYVVNGRSKAKLLDSLRPTAAFTTAFDLLLRARIHEGRLKAFALYPFATSLSAAAAHSQLQVRTLSVDKLWNAFRQLVWIGADRDSVEATLAGVGPELTDPDTRLFCKILEGVLCERYEGK